MDIRTLTIITALLAMLALMGCVTTNPALIENEQHASIDAWQKRGIVSVLTRHVKRGLYVSPNISERKMANARRSCLVPDSEQILGLIDSTVFGSAKNCLLLTETGIYVRNDWAGNAPGRYYLPYPAFRSITIQAISWHEVSIGGLHFEVSGCAMSKASVVDLLTSVQQVLNTDDEGLQSVTKLTAVEANLAHGGHPSAGKIGHSNRQNKWAIIIGISKYQFSGHNGLTNLLFADDDAKAFARSLYNLGWSESHIKLLINKEATQRKIIIALKSWLTKAGPEDQVVLFWAGHGYHDPEDPEKVYLATHDTDISIPVTGYRMDEVRRALEEIGSKNVILIADTCHAGKLITRGDSNRAISIVPNINKMAREQKVPKGWVFMVGADTDRQAIEHTSWTNGAFTHSLIKGLNGEADGFQSAGAKDGVVTLGELKDYMKTSMPKETLKVLGVAKHPVITTSTGDPDIWNLTLQVSQ